MHRGFNITRGDGPLVASALHAGHAVRPAVARCLALDEAARLREEDPFTEVWTPLAPTAIISTTSRFELDLNRPREQAVYRTPADAWGLTVWRDELPPAEVEASLAAYDAFYAEVESLLGDLVQRHGRIVLLDLHSYCHRRDGPDGAAADPELNPAVNVGTGSVDRVHWGPLVERFVSDLAAALVDGCPLDARENVKFQGGHFVRWIHRTFPGSVCALALEMKKTFMDEWTGELDEQLHGQIYQALRGTVPGLLAELAR